jgi:hypothetical protein
MSQVHLPAHRQAPPPHGLGIRHLAAADPSEVAVDEIGTHLALEKLIALAADVLENEQSQHHRRRSTTSPAAAAVGMSTQLCPSHLNHAASSRDLIVALFAPLAASATAFVEHLGGTGLEPLTTKVAVETNSDVGRHMLVLMPRRARLCSKAH